MPHMRMYVCSKSPKQAKSWALIQDIACHLWPSGPDCFKVVTEHYDAKTLYKGALNPFRHGQVCMSGTHMRYTLLTC